MSFAYARTYLNVLTAVPIVYRQLIIVPKYFVLENV